MSIRNLSYLFNPSSIAIIGASKSPKSVGEVVARNLYTGGFDGPVLAVNPHERSIQSALAYHSVDELPDGTPDMAVICTPPETVPPLVEALGRRGTKAVIVISAGFSEGDGAPGKALTQAMLGAAKPRLMRIVGPNCLGIAVPSRGINASFVHLHPKPGSIAFVTQSGAVGTAVVDWATHRNIGFSHVVSLGNMSDVDFGDMLDYLGGDPHTRAILLYIESVTDARKFMSAGRQAARSKPVIVIKAGRGAAAARAAASHTGALAGADEVYDAAFRRAGMLRVFGMVELFDAVETLASGLQIRSDKLTILTNGGGIGVLAAEAVADRGGTIAELAPETLGRLEAVLPPTWSRGNPVDIIGDAPGERYAAALEILLDDPGRNAILVLNCPTAIADSLEAADAVAGVLEKRRRSPVLTSWLGEGAAESARRLFAERRIPSYETPGQATTGFMHLVKYKQSQIALLQTPPAIADHLTPEPERARRVIQRALDEQRSILTEPEAKEVLQAYDVPVTVTETVADPEQAAQAAEQIGPPVVLKILSPDITHKRDVGGVRLNLKSADEVHWAAHRMLETVSRLCPDARMLGFTVQKMVVMRHSRELIAGIAEDPTFGPILLFGQGGTEVEVVRDKAIALPPLNMMLAHELMERTRIWRLLQAYRSVPAADLDAVAMTLVKLSQLLCDLPEVVELDINPLLANPEGVLALDARIGVRRALPEGRQRRLAIRPVPRHLAKEVELAERARFLLRPIQPEDEPAIRDMVAHCTPEDIRLRFFAPMKELSHEAAARLTQIDYDREMAIVAFGRKGLGDNKTVDGADDEIAYGVSRISCDPDGERAEYAVLVRSDMKGRGLGFKLMDEILAYARSRNIKEVFGQVLRENSTMLAMCRELGFTQRIDPGDPELMIVSKRLDSALLPASR